MANTDNEFSQDRIPLHIDDMDVGTAVFRGRIVRATLRSAKIADALTAGHFRVKRVTLELERAEPDAESG